MNSHPFKIVAAFVLGFVLGSLLMQPIPAARAGVDSNSGNAYVEGVALPGTLLDASVTVAVGGTAVTALSAASSTPYHKEIIEDNNQTAVIDISWTGTAGSGYSAAKTYVLQPGQFYTTDPDCCPQNALSVNSPTSGATAVISYD